MTKFVAEFFIPNNERLMDKSFYLVIEKDTDSKYTSG